MMNLGRTKSSNAMTGNEVAGNGRRSRRPARGLVRSVQILAFLPPILIAFLVWKWGVNVLYWDEWDLSTLFLKQADGTISFSDLSEFHNESRLFFPRLVLLGLRSLTDWNVRAEMALTLVLAGAVSYLIHRLERRTFPGRPLLIWTLFFLTNLFLFSPAQVETWLWGLLGVLLVPALSLLLCLWVIGSPLRQAVKLGICMGLASIATFSFANGLLCWVLVLAALLLHPPEPSARAKLAGIAFWTGGFVINVTLFFHGSSGAFQKHLSNGPALRLLEHPVQSLQYFLYFLDTPFAFASSDIQTNATFISSTLAILFGFAWAYSLRFRGDWKLFSKLLPWLLMGSYSILSALLAAIGRSAEFGNLQAFSPRYGTFALYLPIALLHIWFLLGPHLRRQITAPSYRVLLSTAGSFLVVSMVVLHGLSMAPAVDAMQRFHLNRRQARACLMFLKVVPVQTSASTALYPKLDKLYAQANALNERGFFQPPLFSKGMPLNRISATNRGELELVQQLQDSNCFIRCWSLSPVDQRAADEVFFTYEKDGAPPAIIGLADQRVDRPDLVGRFGSRVYLYSGWEKLCRDSDLPKGVLTIRAWAFDLDSQTAGELGGVFTLTKN